MNTEKIDKAALIFCIVAVLYLIAQLARAAFF